ncbi:DUF2207 domain-containing protein [Aliihoeflea sp. 40Bstr573]|uniref:DUF2207 domain-containing protein n=1 Tax=Aliihoeflea sp. 40Bstr573 TaxID=2696467 RepID=UPI0020941A3E|nr:DUF2207 domain-containing protein [Aliihoeflea sp. 40Bstr573]MCO6388349.1 DUF2207 domain-containing protein [Aliihoeflea sp. 40Bstr573]
MTRILASFLVLLALAAGAFAQEEITSFRADIELAADGTMQVTETITVNAEGNQIRRGIFRDFPLRFEDEAGRLREVDFDILSVTRDGDDEPHATERGSGIVRIRIGDADTLLAPGLHTYEITYETGRQIRFFDTHDELYWNVTGNGWDFPIRDAVADIRLPLGVSAEDVAFYTGAFGSTAQDASAQRLDGGNRIIVEADRELRPREGLTVAIAMPKGSVAPPTAAQEREWWLRDNRALFIGALGLAIVLAYYLWAWTRVGRDPPAGVVVPRWEPPRDISPALTSYIDKRGFRGQGWDALSAATINLAVKGFVELDDLDGQLTIRRSATPAANLPVGEAAILAHLPQAGDMLTVDKANGSRVVAVGQSFRTAIEREHRNRFYRHNAGYVFAGIAISVLALLAFIVFGGLSEGLLGLMFATAIPAIVLSVFAVNFGRRMRSATSLGGRLAAVVMMGFAGFVVFSGLSTTILSVILDPGEVMPIAAILGIVMVNAVFLFLMGAPTPLGRRSMDEIGGLKQYLTVAEKERMNMQGAPQMSPRHFETLLPYAVALGVEKPWSRAFDAWLATAASTGAAAGYMAPSWYHGHGFDGGSIGSTMGGLAGSLSDSFTASLPAPQSSSSGFGGGGGGGGFSGGGGGGGGGGGW